MGNLPGCDCQACIVMHRARSLVQARIPARIHSGSISARTWFSRPTLEFSPECVFAHFIYSASDEYMQCNLSLRNPPDHTNSRPITKIHARITPILARIEMSNIASKLQFATLQVFCSICPNKDFCPQAVFKDKPWFRQIFLNRQKFEPQ